MPSLLQDVRYAIRTFLRQPSFAVSAILTLALGIGATTAIFSVVNAVMFRPLRFERSDRIVAILNVWSPSGTRSGTISAPDFYDWKEQNRSFQALAYFTGGEAAVTVNGKADYAWAYRITPEFFDVLAVRAAVGRLLTTQEQAPGGPLAVVISDAFWNQQFNRDASAIGATIKAGERIFTIVGVLPPGLRYPARADIYYPAWLVPESARSAHNYRAIARLRDGVTVGQANSDMTAIASRLETLHPQSNAGKQVFVQPLKDLLIGNMRATFTVLLGAVALLLLIACANVANLLLARASVRSREIVVRAAVGASRRRLVQQLFTESIVLGTVAGLLGVWLARVGVLALLAVAPADLPRGDEIRVDVIALLFAMLTALAASFIFGLAPALQISRTHLVEGLREGKGASAGSRGSWTRSAFVIVEVALAVVLVVGAGLLTRSLAALSSVDMGFDSERLLVLRTSVPVASFKDGARATAFYRDVLEELRALPGVEAVGAVTSLPTMVRSNGGYAIDSGPDLRQTGVRSPQAVFNVVTPHYFSALRVPMRQGRDFSGSDRMGAPYVAIINEALARAAFPGQDPLGRRIQCGLDTLEFMTIVGVVSDIRTSGPHTVAPPEIFMPYEQHPGPSTALNIVARTTVADPLALAEAMRQKIGARNPDVPVRATTMAGTLETASATPRFRTFLLTIFASVALFLALAGVHGVMAYTVSQRIPELGVRMVLGATPRSIMRLILWQGAKLGAIGLALGLVLTLASSRVIEGLLFGVTPRDPLILVAVTGVVAVATFFACYIPGRRAVAVDPMTALRAE